MKVLFTALACSLLLNAPAHAQSTPGCVDGQLTNAQEWFESVIGRKIGEPQTDWEAVLAASGIPDGFGPGTRPDYNNGFFGWTQQIGAGGPRGVLFAPTAEPDDNGFFTSQFLVVDGPDGTWQFLERFPLGPDYAPGKCDSSTPDPDPPPSSDLDAVLELIGDEFASLRKQITALQQQVTDLREWAEEEIAEVRAEHKAAEKQIDNQLPVLNGSKWNTVFQVLGIVAGILGIGATTGVVP